MTMRRMFVGVVLAAVAVLSRAAATPSNGIRASSPLGRSLLQHARALDQEVDYGFIGEYSIKFQGCHHVSQWNADVDDEDDVRIKTKRLVRFRLCPSDSCNSQKSTGCTSKYGDYVVDLNTFVGYYLQAIQDDKEYICQDTATECNDSCNNGNDANCVQSCYEDFGMTYCLEDEDDANDAFDPANYAACTQYDFGGGGRRRLDQVEYYVGPYCAAQGGEIHMGLFTDDTCTTYAQNGEATFYSYAGFELPYSGDSLVSTRCMSCSRSDQDGDGQEDVSEVCQSIYGVSGKCETKMSVDYPNESACTYIEGIKIIREDGVIRTSATRKSKAAAVCIGLFLTAAVLLAGYVYYLRTSTLPSRLMRSLLPYILVPNAPLSFFLRRTFTCQNQSCCCRTHLVVGIKPVLLFHFIRNVKTTTLNPTYL